MPPSSSWSQDRITTLTRLWTDGHSAAQIAKRLGDVTRNAVIGKVHRLGLSGRVAPSQPRRFGKSTADAQRVRPSAAPASSTRHPATRTPATICESNPEGRGLIDNLVKLGRHACKWPIGDPKTSGFTFCGRSAKGRYCISHEAQAVRAGTAWRAERDPVVKRALAGLI